MNSSLSKLISSSYFSGIGRQRNTNFCFEIVFWEALALIFIWKLKHFSYEDKLKELGLFSLKKRWHRVWNYLKEGWQEDEQGSSQWCWASGLEATSRNWHTGDSTQTRGRISLLCSDCAPEQIAQRGCEVYLTGDISKLSGHNPVPCPLGWPCLYKEFRPYDPLWSPSFLLIPWCCETALLKVYLSQYGIETRCSSSCYW